LMKKADLIYNEDNLLQILEGLEARGNWRQALSVTEWVYNENIYKHRKSRFVYTKLLSILGKAWRPTEALRVFTIMRVEFICCPFRIYSICLLYSSLKLRKHNGISIISYVKSE
jgi:hypothetical protein